MFLGDPFHAIVVVDDPAISGHVVWNLGDPELGEAAACCLQADLVDDIQEERVVARDVLVDEEVVGFRDVVGELGVHVLGLLRQAEPAVAPVDDDPAWHCWVWRMVLAFIAAGRAARLL